MRAIWRLPPYVARRWDNSLTKRAAFRLGGLLGDRVLLGKTLGGSEIALSMADHFHRRIYFWGEYEKRTTALFRRVVQPGMTVFDVGANVGYFTMLSRELGAEVHAFEPNPNVRRLLSHSASLQEGITVVPAACSDHEGTMTLWLSPARNTGGSSLERRTDTPIEVEVIVLDDYAKRVGARPDLIKFDVEGHELRALRGARGLLEHARPIVVVETKQQEVVELMRELGYSAHRVLADGLSPLEDLGKAENVCFMP
jgi:FkbM family methyltransferase